MIVRESLNCFEQPGVGNPYDKLNIGNKNTPEKAYEMKQNAERAVSDKRHEYYNHSFTSDDYILIDKEADAGNEYAKLLKGLRQSYSNDFARMREDVKLRNPTAHAAEMLEYKKTVMIYIAIESDLIKIDK